MPSPDLRKNTFKDNSWSLGTVPGVRDASATPENVAAVDKRATQEQELNNLKIQQEVLQKAKELISSGSSVEDVAMLLGETVAELEAKLKGIQKLSAEETSDKTKTIQKMTATAFLKTLEDIWRQALIDKNPVEPKLRQIYLVELARRYHGARPSVSVLSRLNKPVPAFIPGTEPRTKSVLDRLRPEVKQDSV